MNLGVELSYYSGDSVSITVEGTGECSCRHNCVSFCLSHSKFCGLSHRELCCLSYDFNIRLELELVKVLVIAICHKAINATGRAVGAFSQSMFSRRTLLA